MKSTLIFLHGGPGFKDYLKPFFEPLTSKFKCVFYDQIRGPQVKINDMITQLDELVNSLGGKKILVGHSWGGILGIEYAGRMQSKLAGLATMNSGLTSKHWKEEFHKELISLGLENAKPEQIYLSSSEMNEGTKFIKDTWKTLSDETFKSINNSYVPTFDVTAQLASLKIPTINIFSEKDVRFPARVSRTFRDFNNQIVDYEIPNAGHFPFLRSEGRSRIYQILENTFLT